MAADVSPGASGGLTAGHVVGACRRRGVSAGQFRADVAVGQRHACGRASSVYDCRTCRVCRRIRAVFKKHFQKRSVCLRGDCACHSLRQGGIYAVCHCFSVGRAVYSGARVVSDSVWAGRGGRAGGACAARCHGGPPSYAERQQ